MSQNILLIGKPNTGKSLLFQKLTGLYQKVSNFPGVTVEIKKGEKDNLTWIDFPGVYSFNPLTTDEEIAITKFDAAIEEGNVKSVLCVLDATKLEASLVMALQALLRAKENKVPIVFALNMMDDIDKNEGKLNIEGLSNWLGAQVIGISAKTGKGIESLKEALNQAVAPLENVHSTILNDQNINEHAKILNKEFGINNQVFIKKQNRLDDFFLSSFIGGIAFFLIMLIVFQSIFTWAVPLMDLTEEIITNLGVYVTGFISNEILNDFLSDAFFGGFGAFLVFAPQIAVLTFIIGILEDSGYLARAAIIAHKPFKLFGLSGKSFVPYLSGHACAIPAILAARTIESPKKRLLTILTVPLTACSARLPVYSLLIVAFIPASTFLGGLISWQGLSFFALYFLGIFSALIVGLVLSKAISKKEQDAPFIIELPPYRIPSWKPLARKSLRSAWTFVKKAGPIIFIVNFIIWGLGYFPNGAGQLDSSYLAMLGKYITPLVEPLGLNWHYGVAILMSFLAREVFVGTLGTMIGIEAADENILSLATHIQNDGVSLASGMALLVFYALAMQCVSTLAVIKTETGSYKWPVLTFVGYSVLAYIMAFLTYTSLT